MKQTIQTLRQSLFLAAACTIVTTTAFAQNDSERYLNLDKTVDQILQDIGEYARLSGLRNLGAKNLVGGRDMIDIEGRMLELSQKIQAESTRVNNDSNRLENGWRIRNRLAGSAIIEVLDRDSGYGGYGANYKGNFARPRTENENRIVPDKATLIDAIYTVQDKVSQYAKLVGMKRRGTTTFVDGTLKSVESEMLRIQQEVDRESALISNALNKIGDKGLSARSKLPGGLWADVLQSGGSLSIAVTESGRIKKGERVPFYNRLEAPEHTLNGKALMVKWDAEAARNRALVAEYRQSFQNGFAASESLLTDANYAQALAEYHGENGIRSAFAKMNSSHDQVVDPRLNTATNSLYLLGEIDHISTMIRTGSRETLTASFGLTLKKYGIQTTADWNAKSEIFRLTALHGLIALASGVPMTREQKNVWTFFKELIPSYYSDIMSVPWGDSINERVSYLVSAFIREINFAKLHDVVRKMPAQAREELLVKLRGDISDDAHKLVKSFGPESIYEQIILHIDGLRDISSVKFGYDLPENGPFNKGKGKDETKNARVASRYLNLWLMTQRFSEDQIRSWQKPFIQRIDDKQDSLRIAKGEDRQLVSNSEAVRSGYLYQSLLGMSSADQEKIVDIAKANGLKLTSAPKKVRNAKQLGLDFDSMIKSCNSITNR